MGYEQVRARLQAGVKLVAVSKGRVRAEVEHLLARGARDFGENRIPEAEEKFAGLRTTHPDVRLHLIGPLQSNKVAAAIRVFDVIHTLDRDSTAAALARKRDAGARLPQLLVQVNIGEEAQKSGVTPAELEGFLRRAETDYELNISGLMCIPPAGREPETYFDALREAADRHGLHERSMGMSDDYPTAIACGSTMVRIGRALFVRYSEAGFTGS